MVISERIWIDPSALPRASKLRKTVIELSSRATTLGRLWFDTGERCFEEAYLDTLARYEQCCQELLPHLREAFVNLRAEVGSEIDELEHTIDVDNPESRSAIANLLRLHHQQEILDRLLRGTI